MHWTGRMLAVPVVIVTLIIVTMPAKAGVQAAAAVATTTRSAWSNAVVSRTPSGSVTFHGPFGREEVEVTCERLGPHDFIEIEFDLLILRSWDGSVPVSEKGTGRPIAAGPDFFRLGIAGGATLLYTTFSNTPNDGRFRQDALAQNFPSPVAGDVFDAQSGAAARNTLGYAYPWAPPQEDVPMDATYRLRFIIPHRDERVVLQLTGMNLQDLIDESWGISGLCVRPLASADATRPGRDDISAAFREALEAASPDALAAFQTLVLGGDETAEWIRRAVKPQPVDAKGVGELIDRLAADDAAKASREAAAVELRGMGATIEPLLRDARAVAAAAAAPEQRVRIDWLLQGIAVTPIPDPDLRRFILATRALEVIATPRALEVRRGLSEAHARDEGGGANGTGADGAAGGGARQ